MPHRTTTTLLLLSLLLLPARAGAEEEPGPFAGWTAEQVSAHRQAQAGRVMDRARRFFDGRKALTETCRLCQGTGYEFATPGRPSECCAFCGGTGCGVKLRAGFGELDDLYLHHADPDWRARRLKLQATLMAAGQAQRLHREALPLAAFRIREVRVLGEGAAVLAETDSLARMGPDPEPSEQRIEVVRLVLADGEWWVVEDPDDPAWTGASRYPAEHRLRSLHDADALALYSQARERMHVLALPEGMLLEFTVEVRAPWSKRKAKVEVGARPPDPPELGEERMPKDFTPEHASSVRSMVRGMVGSYLDPGFLPDPECVRLELVPGSPDEVAYRGFSVELLGKEGELRFDEEGLPVRWRSRGLEYLIAWERRDDRFVPAKFERVVAEDETPFTVELRYQPWKGLTLPYRIELSGPPGEWDLRLRGFALQPAD